MAPNALSYAAAGEVRPLRPNWPMRLGLALCVLGYAAYSFSRLFDRRWPTFEERVGEAAVAMLLGGLTTGFAGVLTGPRRVGAFASLSLQVLAFVVFLAATALGPGD